MSRWNKLSRRRFLQVVSTGTAGVFAAACGAGKKAQGTGNSGNTVIAGAEVTVTETPFQANSMPGMDIQSGSMPADSMAAPQKATADFKPDVEINLRAIMSEQAVFPGAKTRVWRYQGEVVLGDKNAVVNVPDSYLGPVFVFKRGQKVRVNFTNELPEVSIVHWHGLHVPSVADGLPHQVVGTGGKYVYEFVVDNRAGTYWFHPHPDGRTAFQAYQGLAGLVLVGDEEEAGLGAALPGGAFDVPLVIQDRIIDDQNQWVYPSTMMERMQGVLGDHILVNGRPDFTLPVAATAHRLRFLNGSNARTYKLAWEDGTPWTVIATDGGLLEKPLQRSYLMLSPGERVEVWADFSGRQVGSQVRLVSQAFAGGTMQMMGGMGMMGSMNTRLLNGAEFPVMTVRIDSEGTPPTALPEKLSTMERLVEKDAANAANPRTFALSFMRMTWLMNGRTYEMNTVANDEMVKLNTTEAWVFQNVGMMGMGMMGGMGGNGMMGGMSGMMNMPHVMHLHGVQFLIIGRQVDGQAQADWRTVSEGLIDEGWKDTFLIMPGEQVKFLVRFVDFTGLYMYHCHIIEHEDMGMMRFYRVDA